MRTAQPVSELSRPKCGFDTIGNATIIAYDAGKPVLVTDPWVEGSAYFGSWTHSHRIPTEQKQAILDCPYVWFSHGHPDHLNPDSLELFKGKTILLPDHVGARIKTDLEAMGHQTRVLPNYEWVRLTDQVRILCIGDYYQDAILLLDIGGRLLLDLNDALDRGWGRFVRKTVRQFPVSFLLSLFGYGDADMINFRTDTGELIPPKAAKRHPIGESIAAVTESLGVDYFIPFSSMHRYQRSDSIWAEQYVTPLSDYAIGFRSKTSEILPAFLRYDCGTDQYSEIKPELADSTVYEPEKFGDSWSEPLSKTDQEQITQYFLSIEKLHGFLDFVGFKVGGQETHIPMKKSGFSRGLSFEVPRKSLMTAIEYRIFDDLLIGNFMRTTLIGKWPASRLYPDFIPYVARYADNGNARSQAELNAYFAEYRKRAPIEYFLHQLERTSIDLFRAKVQGGSPLFESGKKLYWYFKGLSR